jgi:hypothetical protein
MSIAKKEALQQLSDERVAIDKILIMIDVFQHEAIKVAFKPLQQSFMWLGLAKKALGAENPYPTSTDASSPRIEPPQDKAASVSIPKDFDVKNPVAVIKFLRAQIDVIIKAIVNDGQIFPDNKYYQICLNNAWTYACNAKMELGLELGKLRDLPESLKKVIGIAEGDTVTAEVTLASTKTETGTQSETDPVVGIPEAKTVDLPETPANTEEPLSGEALLNAQNEAIKKADEQFNKTKADKKQANQQQNPTANESNSKGQTDDQNAKKRGGSKPGKKRPSNKTTG